MQHRPRRCARTGSKRARSPGRRRSGRHWRSTWRPGTSSRGSWPKWADTNASTRCKLSSLAAAARRPAPVATVRRSKRRSTSVAMPVYVWSARARLDIGLPAAATAVCEFISIQRWRRRRKRRETLLRTPRLAAGPRTLLLSSLDDSFTDTVARLTVQFEVAFIPRKATLSR